MGPERVPTIQDILPRINPFPRAVVEAILLSEGSIGSAQLVAQLLGLRNRFKLARLLKQEGLPPLHRLAAWTTILCWVRTAERDGTCLFRLATRWRRHPSACYRLVKEVTGLCWLEVRTRGQGWVERRLMSEFQALCRGKRLHVAEVSLGKRGRRGPPMFDSRDPLLDARADAELDLHGLGAIAARSAVRAFLEGWRRRKAGAVVHIITGKGKGSASGPVLRGLVKTLLQGELRAMVEESQLDDGEGGYRVRVR